MYYGVNSTAAKTAASPVAGDVPPPQGARRHAATATADAIALGREATAAAPGTTERAKDAS